MKFCLHLDLKGSCIKIEQSTWICKRPWENMIGSHQNLLSGSDFKLLYCSSKDGSYETSYFCNFWKSTPVDQNFMDRFHNTLKH